jgi:hypothetical protein
MFRTRRARVLAVTLSCAMLLLTTMLGVNASLAVFSDSENVNANTAAKAIFPAERVTPAFIVGDASAGGSPVDRSSQFGFAADSRTITSSAWSTAFSSSSYLDFDLNASLPAGLAASTASFEFRFASAAGGGTACFYFEVRRISTGAVLGTYGSSGTPLACVAGTTLNQTTSSIASSVTTTDLLNDLRIRVYGRDSGSNGMILDRATVSGTTPYASYTLYPVRYTDAADTTATTLPWELAGP